jgi:RNA polymerase II subunit A small phosphatase-like protein
VSEFAEQSKRESRPLLILDIDETLIFGTETELARTANFRVGPFHIYQRPHVAEFLEGAASDFDLAIWSSATIDYVAAIAAKICPSQISLRFVWGRERCTQRTNFESAEIEYIKDLKKVKRLGYDINRILFLDDTASKLARNFGNAIYVRPYEGGTTDDELPRLLRFLESIKDACNYRTIEKRGWRSYGEND